MPLDAISFEMSTAFGAKCSNVATMRSFDLPTGTIPDGFGIPFYYYDEFMKFNNFYQEAQVMIDNPTFQTDLNFRIDRLKDFRRDIKDAPMPQWMLDNLVVNNRLLFIFLSFLLGYTIDVFLDSGYWTNRNTIWF